MLILLSIAFHQVFNLQHRAEVYVHIVPEKDREKIMLDLVEISFKGQYLGRSDMWRLKESLANECLYLTKAIRFAGTRGSVKEIWAHGQKVGASLSEQRWRPE